MTESELIKKAQSGNDKAIEQLFFDYKDIVTRVSRSYFLIGGDTEDLIQEGMVGLYKAIKNYSDDKSASFKTFAILCIKRQIQTAIKHAHTKKNQTLSNAVPLGEQGEVFDTNGSILILPSPDLDPVNELISKENILEMQTTIIKTLSKFELVILSEYLQGLSYDTIAKNVNKTSKSVDNALSRIKNKLVILKNQIK